jgi:outer membrane protein OmpA-like peptidoglycan-associated protein
MGPQGLKGAPGAQGAVGIVGRWTAYRDFNFDGDQAKLQPSDLTMVKEIAGYMANNPSLRIGIDGSTNSNGGVPTNQDLNDRRVMAINKALTKAGVPASKIFAGTFGDPQFRRDGRVEVLLSTGISPTAQLSD